MRSDQGVRDVIGANDLTRPSGIVEAAADQGMHRFDQYLIELLAAEIVSRETAMTYAVNRHRLEMELRGFGSPRGILQPDEGR